MLKQYFVEFWNKAGQKVGVAVSAQSAIDARYYVENNASFGFGTLIRYPQEIK